MFTLIIPAAIGFLIFFFIGLDEEGLAFGFVLGLFGIVMGAVLGVVVAALLTIPGGAPNVERKDIIALQDNIVTEGHFFLGCGSIDSELTYFYMVKTDDGGYVAEDILADVCIIYEDNPGVPYVVLESRHATLAPWFTFDFG